MRQIKFFKCLEYEHVEMQDRINDWIRKDKIDVVDVKFQLAPQTLGGEGNALGEGGQSDVMCLVIYNAS